MNETKTLLLENDLLQVRILPAFGGKIISLRSLRTGEEFLLPPLQDYRRVSDCNGTARYLNGRERCQRRLEIQLVGRSKISISPIFARTLVSIRSPPD